MRRPPAAAVLGRAFPGRTAGADFLAFLHETSIVIRELGCCEPPEKYKLSTFYASLDCRARPDANRLIDPLSKVRFESEYDRCHRDWSERNGGACVIRP